MTRNSEPSTPLAASEAQPPIADLAGRVREAATALGFGDGRYDLIQASTNIVFENLKDRAVARVASDHIRTWGIAARLDECQQLAAAGAPFLTPLRSEVFRLAGGERATFWPLASYGVDLNGHDLASLASATHRVEPPIHLNEWRPQLRRPGQLRSLEAGVKAGLPEADASQLRGIYDRRLQDLVLHWQQADPPTTLLHGDLSPRNVIRLHGQLLMCDPDNLCQGPVEADLAQIKLNCHQLGPDCWQQFLASYPLDYDQKLLDKAFAVGQIGALMWLTHLWQSDPETQAQIKQGIDQLVQDEIESFPESVSAEQKLAEAKADADYLAAELIESVRQLRTDQPHPGMVDNIAVDGAGGRSINQLAVVKLAGSENLAIEPFDPADIEAIARALLAASHAGWRLDKTDSKIGLEIPATDERKQQAIDQLQMRLQASLSRLHRQQQKTIERLDPACRIEGNQIYGAVEKQMRWIAADRRQTIIDAVRPKTSPTLARLAAESQKAGQGEKNP